MSRLKIRTTVTFTATSFVDGEAVTKKDVANIKREVKESLDYGYAGDLVEGAVGRATWGRTTVRKPVIAVEPVEEGRS